MKTMITLYADEGKILTNGTDYGTTVSLAEGVNADKWHEIDIAEYQKLEQEVEYGQPS